MNKKDFILTFLLLIIWIGFTIGFIEPFNKPTMMKAEIY